MNSKSILSPACGYSHGTLSLSTGTRRHGRIWIRICPSRDETLALTIRRSLVDEKTLTRRRENPHLLTTPLTHTNAHAHAQAQDHSTTIRPPFDHHSTTLTLTHSTTIRPRFDHSFPHGLHPDARTLLSQYSSSSSSSSFCRKRWTLDKMWEMNMSVVDVAAGVPPPGSGPSPPPPPSGGINPRGPNEKKRGSSSKGMPVVPPAEVPLLRRNAQARQAGMLLEQARQLNLNFTLLQIAIAAFLLGLAMQYLYFAIVATTEREWEVRWMNITSQILGALSMLIAAVEMGMSHRPIDAERTFQDRWERNMIKLGAVPDHWRSLLHQDSVAPERGSMASMASSTYEVGGGGGREIAGEVAGTGLRVDEEESMRTGIK